MSSNPKNLWTEFTISDSGDIVNKRIVTSDEIDTDVDRWGLDGQKKALENKRYSKDTWHRSYLSFWSTILSTVWILFVGFLLIFNHKMEFNLSDEVIIALLTTTTLNLLGLPLIVLRGLFNVEGKSSK